MLEGDLAMAQKRYREALELYRKAGAKGTSRELGARPVSCRCAGRDATAGAGAGGLGREEPERLDVVAVLAEARQRKGDIDGAIAALRAGARARRPTMPVMLNNLAVLYDAQGQPEGGRARRDAPTRPRRRRRRSRTPTAGSCSGGQDRQGAAVCSREAAKGLPNNAEVQYHYAAALAKKGDKAEAVALLKKAVDGQLPANAKADAQKLLEQLSK